MLLQVALFGAFYCWVIFHIFFIHSSVNGHLGCFRVLPFVNSAVINIGVCVLADHSFSDTCLAVGLQSYDDYVPYILMSVILFFTLFEKVECKNINMLSTWAPILKFSLTLYIRHHFIFEWQKDKTKQAKNKSSFIYQDSIQLLESEGSAIFTNRNLLNSSGNSAQYYVID